MVNGYQQKKNSIITISIVLLVALPPFKNQTKLFWSNTMIEYDQK